MITIGGDGTILYASKIFAFYKCPALVCFSMGSLGYLCNFKITDYQFILDCVFDTHLEEEQISSFQPFDDIPKVIPNVMHWDWIVVNVKDCKGREIESQLFKG